MEGEMSRTLGNQFGFSVKNGNVVLQQTDSDLKIVSLVILTSPELSNATLEEKKLLREAVAVLEKYDK